jgi:hypothetical protein
MLGEAIAGGVTLVTLASLWLASAIDKRERRDETEPDEWIEPFCDPALSRCPFCKCCGLDKTESGEKCGPGAPRACKEGQRCPGYPRLHLHVECRYCGATWMRAASVKP